MEDNEDTSFYNMFEMRKHIMKRMKIKNNNNKKNKN